MFGASALTSQTTTVPFFHFTLVDNRKAKQLIGMDVMGHEGFRLDLDAKTVKIASCMGLSVPIAVHAKPHHAAECPVYADAHVVV